MLINKTGVVIDVAVGRTWVTSFRRILMTVHALLTKSNKPAIPARRLVPVLVPLSVPDQIPSAA